MQTLFHPALTIVQSPAERILELPLEVRAMMETRDDPHEHVSAKSHRCEVARSSSCPGVLPGVERSRACHQNWGPSVCEYDRNRVGVSRARYTECEPTWSSGPAGHRCPYYPLAGV